VSTRRIDPAMLVLAGGIAAAMHVGKLPTAIPVLRAELGVTIVEAGFLLALVQFAGMLLGLVAGLLADTLGLKRTMAQGLALLAVASALGAFANDVRMLMVLRAVEGLGFLFASMPAPSLIRRLVEPHRVNAALGWWGAFMPIGTASALLAGPFVMHAIGWRGWWAVLAAVAAAMSAVIAWMLPQPANARPGGGAPWRARLLATLRAPGPWLVALCFGVYSAQWLSLVGFLPTVNAQAGIAAASAGAATALVALVTMVGNVGAGRLLQRGARPPVLLAAGFAAMGAGAVLAFAELPGALRFAGALVFSMAGGLVPGTLFSLSVRFAPGEDTVSTTVGWMQQWSALGQFCGPPVVAAVAAAVGGWQWSGAVTGAFAMAGLVLSVLVAKQPAHRH
jgi:predicted MFS family arabinose efflux permease